VPLISKGSVLEQVEEETQGELANPPPPSLGNIIKTGGGKYGAEVVSV